MKTSKTDDPLGLLAARLLDDASTDAQPMIPTHLHGNHVYLLGVWVCPSTLRIELFCGGLFSDSRELESVAWNLIQWGLICIRSHFGSSYWSSDWIKIVLVQAIWEQDSGS